MLGGVSWLADDMFPRGECPSSLREFLSGLHPISSASRKEVLHFSFPQGELVMLMPREVDLSLMSYKADHCANPVILLYVLLSRWSLEVLFAWLILS